MVQIWDLPIEYHWLQRRQYILKSWQLILLEIRKQEVEFQQGGSDKMFIIQINEIDSSCHTQECDALVQKQRYLDSGISEEDIEIVEKDTFAPPQSQE